MREFGGTTITIRQLKLQQTGRFVDVYNRPFTMDLRDGAIEKVKRRLNGNKNARITDRAFKGLASGILVPRTEINRERDGIYIPEGWDSRRCRFMMEVEISNRLGGDKTYFLQGFTDHDGLSDSGNVDPKMVFYINGYIAVKYAVQNGRLGKTEKAIVTAMAQVINGRFVYDRRYESKMTRTVDLFSDIQRRFYDSGFTEDVDDDRAVIGSKESSHIAKREDNLSGQYLASAIDTYRRNLSTVSFGIGREDVLGLTEQELNSDIERLREADFFSILARVRGETESVEFTIEDILDADPEAARVITGTRLQGRALGQLATTDNASNWSDETLEAVWATQIANSLGAIMMSNYHMVLDITATNLTIDGRTQVDYIDSKAVVGSLPRELLDSMIERVEDMLDDMAAAHGADFDVEINASLYDQTYIDISLNGEARERFYVPSFADSLMAPFYSRDSDTLPNLSSDLEKLIDECTSEISNISSTSSIGGI